MTETPHTLYDDFDYRGKFWFRQYGRKIDGTLRVKGGREIYLDLADTFGSLEDFFTAEPGKPVIHGQTDRGMAVSLLGCYATNQHIGGAGHSPRRTRPASAWGY